MSTPTMENPSETSRRSALGVIGAAWGVLGVCALLLWAVYRLSLVTIEAFDYPLTTVHWVFLVGFLFFMLYSEGWRGFHKAFAPRTAARARHIMFHPTPIRVLLAPLFCMCFFDATRKRLIVAYVLTSSIVIFILLIRLLPQPWRGLTDFGVVAGLSVGTLSLLYFSAQALFGRDYAHPPETSTCAASSSAGESKSDQIPLA